MSGYGNNNPIDAIIGQNIGRAINESRAQSKEAGALHRANNNILEANKRLNYAEPLAQDYQTWLSSKKDSPTQFGFDIWAEMRPDQRDPKKMKLEQKRVFNLHLIAWTEWWAESVRGGDLVAKEKAPRLRELSNTILQAGFDAQAAAKALADIASRLELAKGMDNPREWVKQRVNAMWAVAEWKQNEPSVPIYSSLSPYPPVSQKRVDDSGGKFDVLDHNLYGVNEMMLK